MAKDLTTTPAETKTVVITKEFVQDLLRDLFISLEDATEDTVTAVMVLEELRDGIKADPTFSKMILTPDNIRKAVALKQKAATKGGLKPADFEQAFPEVVAQVPFWGLAKTFM